MYTGRDSVSPNAADASDSKDDDDRYLRRKRDVTVLSMTSLPTASGPQTSVVRPTNVTSEATHLPADVTRGKLESRDAMYIVIQKRCYHNQDYK